MRPYNLDGRDLIWAWLEAEPNGDRREIMLAWLADIAERPHAHGISLPGHNLPVYLAYGRLGDVTIKYFVAEQFRTVKIIAFGRLP